jgi:hypothetical protein
VKGFVFGWIGPDILTIIGIIQGVLPSYMVHVYTSSLSPLLFHNAYTAFAFPFSCASSFRLAANIISSFLFCIFFCLSFLS